MWDASGMAMLLRTMIWVAVFEGDGCSLSATLGPPTSGCSSTGPRCQMGKDGIMILMGNIFTFGNAVFGLIASSRSSHVEGLVPVDGLCQRSDWILRALT